MSFQTPITRLSHAMCEFLNISDSEKLLSRSEIAKQFFNVCKAKGIYQIANQFQPSEELRTLLAEELTILTLHKYLLPHMIDVEQRNYDEESDLHLLEG